MKETILLDKTDSRFGLLQNKWHKFHDKLELNKGITKAFIERRKPFPRRTAHTIIGLRTRTGKAA